LVKKEKASGKLFKTDIFGNTERS